MSNEEIRVKKATQISVNGDNEKAVVDEEENRTGQVQIHRNRIS